MTLDAVLLTALFTFLLPMSQVLVYPIGILLFYFYILHNVKDEIKSRNEPSNRNSEETARVALLLKPLRPIYDIYLPEFW